MPSSTLRLWLLPLLSPMGHCQHSSPPHTVSCALCPLWGTKHKARDRKRGLCFCSGVLSGETDHSHLSPPPGVKEQEGSLRAREALKKLKKVNVLLPLTITVPIVAAPGPVLASMLPLLFPGKKSRQQTRNPPVTSKVQSLLFSISRTHRNTRKG